MNTSQNDPKVLLMQAALSHVPFDGWSPETFDAAVSDSGVNPDLAIALCPRGAVDLAVAYHKASDAAMLDKLAAADLSEHKFRDKIAAMVRFRIEACDDKELVRRGSALFALPKYAPEGARLIWETCDAIWSALGDTSDDLNWYSKRATLSGVYGSTVLFWLGDESENFQATWDFLDRRIENVMQFEKVKARFNASPMAKVLSGPLEALGRIRAPARRSDLPGRQN